MEMKTVLASAEDLKKIAGGAVSGQYRYYLHTVVKGDTLGKLARDYGSTVDLIFNANDIIKDRNLIRIGWKLIIPVPVKK